ncbi:MAG: hypothetical protein H0T98_03865 [Euzebyaceae bacterium]|jgi:hypothetical protein|nr:hypothetical protein [Euzebyaceae bacterium]
MPDWTLPVERRLVTVAGVVLAVFGVVLALFPGVQGIPLWARLAIGGVWLLGTLLLRRGANRQQAQLDDLLEPLLERRELQRTVAGARLIRALLAHSGFSSSYEFRLYLLDADEGLLLPSYEPEDSHSSTGWAIGQGVTGRAYETGEYDAARGADLLDPGYGLDAEQLGRYAGLQVVAAMPVRSARNEVVAILTGSSTADDGMLTSPEGKDRHAELADVVARVLIDILQVAGD